MNRSKLEKLHIAEQRVRVRVRVGVAVISRVVKGVPSENGPFESRPGR